MALMAAVLVLGLADAELDEESMLQMLVVKKAVETDTSDCRCPGYFVDQCRDNRFQGCVWPPDVGDLDSPWCQCDPNFVPTLPLYTNASPAGPPTAPPAPAPAPAPPSNIQAPVAACPAGWEQQGEAGADIGGCGLQTCDERYDITSEAACATRCDENEECAGFSYAPMNGDRNHPGVKACTIYSSDSPTGTWTGTEGIATQVFCIPTPVHTCIDGDVKAVDASGAELETLSPGVEFLPWVRFQSEWYDLCGHWFWNTEDGAQIFCNQLGFEHGQLRRSRHPLQTDGMVVGICQSSDTSLTDCSGNSHGRTMNHWGNFASPIASTCVAGQPAGVMFTCSGGTDHKVTSCQVQ